MAYNDVRDMLIENAINAIIMPSLANWVDNIKSGTFGFGRPVGICLTISILKLSKNFAKYEAVVAITTLKFNNN